MDSRLDKDKHIRKLQDGLDDLLKRYAKQESIIANKNKYINQLEKRVLLLADHTKINIYVAQLEQRIALLEQDLL